MAVLTITTSAGEEARFLTAVGQSQNLGRDATAGEGKAFVISLLRQFVQQQEYIAAQQLISNVAFNPT